VRINRTGRRQRRERHPLFIRRRILAKTYRPCFLPRILHSRNQYGFTCQKDVLACGSSLSPFEKDTPYTMPCCATLRNRRAARLKTRLVVVHGKLSSRDCPCEPLYKRHYNAVTLAALTQPDHNQQRRKNSCDAAAWLFEAVRKEASQKALRKASPRSAPFLPRVSTAQIIAEPWLFHAHHELNLSPPCRRRSRSE
jgi:hypothetical protein